MMLLSIDPSTVTLQGASSGTGKQVPEGLRGLAGSLREPAAWKNGAGLRPGWTGEGARPHHEHRLFLVFAGLLWSQITGLADLIDVQPGRGELRNLASAPGGELNFKHLRPQHAAGRAF